MHPGIATGRGRREKVLFDVKNDGLRIYYKKGQESNCRLARDCIEWAVSNILYENLGLLE